MKNNFLSQKKPMRSKAIISFLFIVAASLSAYSQDSKSAVEDFGEHHQFLFIGAILIGVGILVLAVYLIFRKSIKEQTEAAKLPPPSGFAKGVNRIGKNDDRRYGTHKTVHQAGGFTRR